MCGLIAGVGKLNSNRMIALGSMSEGRGTDSVGIAYMLNGSVTVAKVAERPCVGLNIQLKKAVTEAAVSGVFIGHTRQATQGDVTARNAHPFLVDDIAFAHNGIIINDDDFGKYEVDSESLIYGIKARDFSKYEGCIALVWLEGGKLRAYRGGNPLYRGRFAGSTYLASDDEYLAAIGCTHVKQLSEGFIYTFHDAFKVTTERVNKNKAYTYSGIGGKYAYDYGFNTGTGWEDRAKIISPAQRQTEWWKEQDKLDQMEEERERALIVKEDFRTPSDIAKSRAAMDMLDYCETCGNLDTLLDGEMCGLCVQWMKDNGLTERDLPVIAHMKSLQRGTR